MSKPNVSIRPWEEADYSLLVNLNTEEMWEHLGGPEPEDKLKKRHKRYLISQPGVTRMFAVLVNGEQAGSVGYWERNWQNQEGLEVGWMVLPAFQGQGVATLAMGQLLEMLRSDSTGVHVYAFPSAENKASNAICKKLGFDFIEPIDFEFPPGKWMKCNVWKTIM